MPNPSLIDKLREVADFVPISHIPVAGEIAKVIGALALYVEHGDSLFQVAERGAQEVHNLIAPAEEGAPAPSAASGFSPAAPSPEPGSAPQQDLQAENAALRQQLATAEAAARQTQASVEPDADDTPVPTPPAPDVTPPVTDPAADATIPPSSPA
jgi:hypothetical protein